jgi:HEPN domain-containing protein
MLNNQDASDRLREAEEALVDVRTIMPLGRLVNTAQRAQLCVEYSAKAVISCFARPAWEHDPGSQLLALIQESDADIRVRFDDIMIQRLIQLAHDAADAAPWHVMSTYGRREPDSTRRWPTDLCTQANAQRLAELAERSFLTAREFITAWLNST